MKNSIYAALSFLLFLVVIFIGCTDTPDPVGVSSLPAEDLPIVRIDTFYATSHATSPAFLSTMYLDQIMVGSHTTADLWMYDAWSYLKFTRWNDSLNGVAITSAKVLLKRAKSFEDTLKTPSFIVHAAIRDLTGDSLSYDSLKTLGNFYFNSAIVPTIATSDSGWMTFTITDTALVRTWFDTSIDTLGANHGLVLEPTTMSDVIGGFYSFNAYDEKNLPLLYVTYKKNGIQNTYIHRLGFSRYVATTRPPASVRIKSDSLRFYIQSGVSYHASVFFDKMLPPYSILTPKASIYDAILELTADSINTRKLAHDSLLVYQANSDGSIDLNSSVRLGTYKTNFLNKKIYQFNVRPYLTTWLMGTVRRGLTFSGVYEGSSFDMNTLIGTASSIPKSLRPKIIVTYYSKQ